MKEVFSLFVIAFFMMPFAAADAATLYIEPNATDIYTGDTLALAVRLDTDEGECVNVVDGVINFPPSIIPVDVALGNSILPVWVEEPTIDKDSGKVTFAGGIPNGYCGRIEGDPRLTNVLLELIVQTQGAVGVPEGGTEVVEVAFSPASKIYLNDGFGTLAQLKTLPARITVHNTSGDAVINEWNTRIDNDAINPSKFSITLSKDPSIFGGRYFIAFNTTDKQSGLDHYEVIEEPLDQLNLFKWGAVDAPWVRAKSPYKLKDQSLNSTIRVKAVDKAGNEYIAVYVPEESIRGLSKTAMLVVGLGTSGALVLIVLLIVLYVYRRKVRSFDAYVGTDKDKNFE